jgi:hypothetical protein
VDVEPTLSVGQPTDVNHVRPTEERRKGSTYPGGNTDHRTCRDARALSGGPLTQRWIAMSLDVRDLDTNPGLRRFPHRKSGVDTDGRSALDS